MPLEAKNITFSYNRDTVLKNFSVTLTENDFIMLLGPNGSGKSTALKLLSGYLQPDSGTVLCDGKKLDGMSSFERASKIAVVSQISPPLLDFTVEEMIMMGRISHTPRLTPPSASDYDKIHEIMKSLEIFHLTNRLMHQLSGGERQRVWLAQALAQEPEYLLLDEPASALDPEHTLNLLNFLRTLQGKTGILMICHDLNSAWNFAEKVIILKNGTISSSGKTSTVLTSENIVSNFNCRAFIHPDEGIILR